MPARVDPGDVRAGAPPLRIAGNAVEVLVSEPRWRRAVPNAERLVRRAARIARAGSGSVMLADDLAVRRLNWRHRGRNKPTNVLTFPIDEAGGGDIVLAYGVVRREAAAAGRPVQHHFAHLVLHGLLHLSGHDHEAAGAARRMEREEARLLSRLGVPNPWKPRGGAKR